MSEKVLIFDTTLRDGEQAPGMSMTEDEKILVAKQLANLNVDIIEAGFPISSDMDFKAVERIAKTIKGPIIAGLARARQKDIEVAYNAVKHSDRPRIHTFIATSPIHMEYKLKMSPDEVIQAAEEAVKFAKRFVNDVEFSAEDATRSKPDFLVKVFTAAIHAGATTINIPDTVGYTVPEEFRKLILYLRENIPEMERAVISVHCHDDLGLAVANSLVAIEAGARQVECTIDGIGERAGNASLEEIVMALKTRKDFFNHVHTDINTKEIYKSSRVVAEFTGLPIPPNKAIIGDNAFSHEAGIHQHGIIQKRETYEIIKPEEIGAPHTQLVLGKHSGKHAFRAQLEELGYKLTEEELSIAFEEFKKVASAKKSIYESDLEAIVLQKIYKKSHEDIISLKKYSVYTNSEGISKAAVELLDSKGNTKSAEAEGNGPVDALFNAINSALDVEPKLKTYKIKSVSEGKDAMGETFLTLICNNKEFSGRGLSVNILESNVNAYLSACNKYLSYRREMKNRGKEK